MSERSRPSRRRARALVVALCLGVAGLIDGCGGAARETNVRAPRPETPRSRGVTTRTEARSRDREAIDDADVARAVQRRIGRDEGIPPGAVSVRVARGIVTLSGTVDHLLADRRAATIAAATRGVRGVVDRLAVRPPARDDEAIARDVARALELHPVTDPDRVEVEVADGRVRLSGRAESLAEKELAEEVAAGVRGVRELESAIEVVPARVVGDDRIRAAVVARLQQDARLDPGGVEVAVDDGRVVLDGVVGSESERRIAAWIATLSGAREVDASSLDVQWWARDGLRRAEPTAVPPPARIEEAVRDAIAQDPRVSADDLRVRVDAGVATLEGRVRSAVAKRAAADDARFTIGVWAVDDRLAVLPDPLIDDASLEDRVCDLLGMSPYVDAEPIDIRVQSGVATLLGEVPSRLAREEAGRLAAEVDGVREVDNRLEVDPRWEPLDDWELAEEIQNDLAWSPFLDRLNVQVTVEDGVATLRGEVDDLRAHREAEREAREAGAIEVRNELRVRGAPEGAPPALPAPRPR